MARGLQEAFEEIYHKYAGKIYSYILSLCNDPVQAEDILQTTFLKAIEHADRFQGNCEVTTWLCQIARNTYLDECKRAEKKNISMERLLEEGGDGAVYDASRTEPPVLHRMIAEEDRARILYRLHQLPEPYKEIFMLRTFGELSFKEIAEVFERTETWARVNYYRAKEKIREQMKEEE